MARILLVTLGTRGDVQPFVALAARLQRQGHTPELVVNADLAPWAARAGVRVLPMAVDVSAYYERADVQGALAESDAWRMARVSRDWFTEIAPAIAEPLASAVQRADAVVSGFLVDDFAAAFAEARGLPFALVQFAPYLPCAEHASILLTTRALPTRLLRALSHRLAERFVYAARRAPVAALRRSLGLGARSTSLMARLADEGTCYLGAFSPLLWPRPASFGPNMQLTGPFRLAQEERARLGEGAGPARLTAWLDDGPAPTLISFGSLPLLDPARLLAACARHARAHGSRFLVAAGASAPVSEHGLPDSLLVLREAVSHDLLLPRCAGYVHHGGAGSTHAALGAGLPSWVVPLFADGPFWGSCVARAGVGGVTPYRAFDERALAHALGVMARREVRARARALAEGLAEEDGTGAAMHTLERLLERRRREGHGHDTTHA